ncbi:hypothetical protein CBOM_05195 [Ceraceosorus bombacis]|uniref:Uncharacterized protein n=1 Tax=Ceraceosorus bombacis TaxID=401625 RepID=A0A0P1BIA3_9BASI|nr:hypothetical protein CBOM_05195 [Ceraceosorus bombacis]
MRSADLLSEIGNAEERLARTEHSASTLQKPDWIEESRRTLAQTRRSPLSKRDDNQTAAALKRVLQL